jgi:hypothetical protein
MVNLHELPFPERDITYLFDEKSGLSVSVRRELIGRGIEGDYEKKGIEINRKAEDIFGNNHDVTFFRWVRSVYPGQRVEDVISVDSFDNRRGIVSIEMGEDYYSQVKRSQKIFPRSPHDFILFQTLSPIRVKQIVEVISDFITQFDPLNPDFNKISSLVGIS